MMRSPPPQTSRQVVLPPYRTVVGPGDGIEPRVPQQRTEMFDFFTALSVTAVLGSDAESKDLLLPELRESRRRKLYSMYRWCCWGREYFRRWVPRDWAFSRSDGPLRSFVVLAVIAQESSHKHGSSPRHRGPEWAASNPNA